VLQDAVVELQGDGTRGIGRVSDFKVWLALATRIRIFVDGAEECPAMIKELEGPIFLRSYFLKPRTEDQRAPTNSLG
jgi:hypothetical protein